MKYFKEFVADIAESNLIESSLSRIYNNFKDPDLAVAVMTAFRGEKTLQENRRRNEQLEDLIWNGKTKNGYGFVKVVGKWVETNSETGNKQPVYEESFMINAPSGQTGELKESVMGWMKKFEQEGALFKPGNSSTTYLMDRTGKFQFSMGRFGVNSIREYMTFLADKISTARKAEADVKSFYFESLSRPKNIGELLLVSRE